MLSNSLTKSGYYSSPEELVKIQNPLSNELDVMRQTMTYNGLETIVYNQNRKSGDLKLFEWGKTYLKIPKGFREDSCLSVFVSGRINPENWNTGDDEVNFYYIKGIVNAILEKFGLDKLNIQVTETDDRQLDYGLKYTVKDMDLVQLGKIGHQVQNQFDIDKEVYYATFNYDTFLKLVALNRVTYHEVPKYPLVRRDLALLIDKEVSYDSIKQIALKQEKRLLKAVNLFDVYEGKKLGEGKKSYGISFKFQDESKTLTDAQIDQTMDKIITSLVSELKVQLR